MKVLTRYWLRAHIGPFFFAFVALTGVILINTLAKELANLAGKGLPLSVVFEFFLLSLPANIALTLPMAVLVSVLYTFSTMAAENEITALRASGVDLRRAALPLVFTASLIAAGMVWFNDTVLPAANYRWRVLITDVAQTRPLLYLKSQTLNPIRTANGTTPFYLEARRIDATTGFLEDVAIYDVSNGRSTRTIYADSGRMAFNQDRTDLLLTLYDGSISEVDFVEPSAYHLVDFEQQVMKIEGVSDRLERTMDSSYRTDRDMTVAMMQARIDSLRAERDTLLALFQEVALANEKGETGDAGGLSAEAEAALRQAALREAGRAALADQLENSPVTERPEQAQGRAEPAESADPNPENIRYARARIENLEYQIREYQVEIHKKYSIALATLVFVLIGIPIALRFPSGGIGMVIAVSLGIFGIYYVGLIGGENLGNPGYVPPAVAMWATNAIFGVLGVIGFMFLGREHGTARNQGWGELPRWLRMLRLRRADGTDRAPRPAGTPVGPSTGSAILERRAGGAIPAAPSSGTLLETQVDGTVSETRTNRATSETWTDGTVSETQPGGTDPKAHTGSMDLEARSGAIDEQAQAAGTDRETYAGNVELSAASSETDQGIRFRGSGEAEPGEIRGATLSDTVGGEPGSSQIGREIRSVGVERGAVEPEREAGEPEREARPGATEQTRSAAATQPGGMDGSAWLSEIERRARSSGPAGETRTGVTDPEAGSGVTDPVTRSARMESGAESDGTDRETRSAGSDGGTDG